jgi:hypothetical protein
LPGKKLMTVRIVKHAFEIIHLLSGENPLQVCYWLIVDIVGSDNIGLGDMKCSGSLTFLY